MNFIWNPLKLSCNVEGILNKKEGLDKTGQPIYGDPMIIYVKKEEGVNTKFLYDNQEVISNGVYYSLDKVNIGDKIDGNIIKGVKTERDIYGKILGYKLLY